MHVCTVTHDIMLLKGRQLHQQQQQQEHQQEHHQQEQQHRSMKQLQVSVSLKVGLGRSDGTSGGYGDLAPCRGPL